MPGPSPAQPVARTARHSRSRGSGGRLGCRRSQPLGGRPHAPRGRVARPLSPSPGSPRC